MTIDVTIKFPDKQSAIKFLSFLETASEEWDDIMEDDTYYYSHDFVTDWKTRTIQIVPVKDRNPYA